LYFLYCFQYFSFRLSVLVLLLSFHANSKPPQIGLICTKNIIIYKNILYQSKLFLAATSRFKRKLYATVNMSLLDDATGGITWDSFTAKDWIEESIYKNILYQSKLFLNATINLDWSLVFTQ
ncbi:hypothetical protein ACJX0J_028252, partial [Zea mays]